MQKNLLAIFVFVLLVFTVVAGISVYTKPSNKEQNDNNITWYQVSSDQLLEERENMYMQLVDLREEELFQLGHIPGSINIPYEDFQKRAKELQKDQRIILICHTGRMGEESAQFLVNEGFNDVFNLEGGIAEWSGPLETK